MSVDTSDAHEVRLLQDKHHESELQRRRAEHELELKREEAEAQQQEAERLRGVAAQMEGHLQAVETEAAAARAGLEIAVEEREAEAAKAAGAAEAAEAAEREAAGWRTKVEEMEAELKKSHTCAQGALEASLAQSARLAQLESDVRARDSALEILRREYETAKARVRRCREEHRGGTKRRSSVASNDSQVRSRGAETTRETANREDEEEVTALSALCKRLEHERDDLHLMVGRLQTQLKEAGTSVATTTATAAAQNLEITAGTEVELRVSRERKKHQHAALKRRVKTSAALRALRRAASAYASVSETYAARCRRTLALLARRLAGTVDFLERLFALEGSGALDFSAMSASMREQMRRSMDEGRRLSQSLLQSRSFTYLEKVTEKGRGEPDKREDVNETQRSTNASPEGQEEDADSEIPSFRLPKLDLVALLTEEEQNNGEKDDEDGEGDDDSMDVSHFCERLESALEVVRRLKEEKARLTQQLERIRDDLNENVGCMTEELKKIVGENNALQSRLEAAEDEARRAVQRMEAAEKREQERDENYCDCLKRIQELERLLKEARSLYEESEGRLRRERDRQDWMRTQARKEVDKSIRVLKVANRALLEDDSGRKKKGKDEKENKREEEEVEFAAK